MIDQDQRRKWRREGWKWCVRAYYASTVAPPKTADGLAIETLHRTDSSKDMEMMVANSRPDIGLVEATPI